MTVGELIERNLLAAYGVARAAAGSDADAEDAVGDAVAAMLSAPGRYDPELPFLPYFASAVVNAARKRQRAERRRAAREEAVMVKALDRPERDSAEHRESVDALRAALAGLPDGERLAVVLTCAEGFSQAQAGEILGLPQRTVSDHARRGLERLRSALSSAGISAAALGPLVAEAWSAPVPAGLAAKVSALVGAGGVGAGLPGAALAKTGASAMKGGVIVKIGLGIATAGLVAGGIFWAVGGTSGEPAGAARPTPAPATANWQDEQWTVEEFTGHVSGGPGWGPAAAVGTGAKNVCGGRDGLVFLVPGGGSAGSAGVQRIDVVTAGGVRYPLAGTGAPGYRDGPAEEAQFHMGKNAYYGFSNIQADGRGNVYVSDSGNKCVRRIFKDKDGKWMVETSAGGGTKKLKAGESCAPREADLGGGTIMVAAAQDGQLTIASEYGGAVHQMPPDGKTIVCRGAWDVKGPDGKAVTAFHYCTGDCDLDGNAYFNTRTPAVVLKATPGGELSWIGGKIAPAHSTPMDGPPLEVAFFAPSSGCVDPRGACFYVCGGDEYFIRRIPTDAKTITACLMQNGRWYSQLTSNKGNMSASRAFELDPAMGGKSRAEGGELMNLVNCHICGRDAEGAIYGTQYPWIQGWSQMVKGQDPVTTSIYRIRRVK